jgi:hypothetical protein
VLISILGLVVALLEKVNLLQLGKKLIHLCSGFLFFIFCDVDPYEKNRAYRVWFRQICGIRRLEIFPLNPWLLLTWTNSCRVR